MSKTLMTQDKLKTPQDAISWIRDKRWNESKLGLKRMAELLDRLGGLQNNLKFIHIAGTNGKGSVAAMLSSVLIESGSKTGLFTSPYLHSFNEQMRIDGEPIPDDELVLIGNMVKCAAEDMTDHPTEFELITAIAILWFARETCGVVVLETGLGGRLDATNVIPPPVLAIITSISRDHMVYLGDTLDAIAKEKAGIIKEGSPVISAPQPEGAADVIKSVCDKLGVPLSFADSAKLKRIRQDMQGQTFIAAEDICGKDGGQASCPYYIPLIGDHQLLNASVVLTGVEVLNKNGWDIRSADIRSGLAKVSWPGRMELIQTEPVPVFIDGAHNVAGVRSAADTLTELFPGKRFNFVFGVLKDKEWREMFEIIAPIANRLKLVTPNSDRALLSQELAALLGMPQQIESLTMEQGLSAMLKASKQGEVVCVLGSLYLQK
jgi:dihydrofolate synthase/folylpolyglutamate synthase